MGYKETNPGAWTVDAVRWNNILDITADGSRLRGGLKDHVSQSLPLCSSGRNFLYDLSILPFVIKSMSDLISENPKGRAKIGQFYF